MPFDGPNPPGASSEQVPEAYQDFLDTIHHARQSIELEQKRVKNAWGASFITPLTILGLIFSEALFQTYLAKNFISLQERYNKLLIKAQLVRDTYPDYQDQPSDEMKEELLAELQALIPSDPSSRT